MHVFDKHCPAVIITQYGSGDVRLAQGGRTALKVRYEREADVCVKVRVFVADDEKVQVRQSVNTTYEE
ncbi:hypothetical protein PAFU01_37290 [Pantoea ananatis]|nr:hypothetical protein PAFU01_37290 [Pantoea ananatis]